MTKRTPILPAYIGRARHIWEVNRCQIEELIQDALNNEASEITLTIDVPDNAPARKRISVAYTAVLPVSTGFRVVQIDELNIYEIHAAPTWDAACAWLVANERSLPRNRQWELYGTGGPLFSHTANLLTWDTHPTADTPPTRRKEPPADRYALPKRP